MTVISLQRVSKSFGAVHALDGVDLTVARGEFIGLLGPNGAGKSTLLAVLLGLRRPDSGVASVFGVPPDAARARIGSTPQQTALPDGLRVGEVIDFVGAHYPHRADRSAIVSQFQLEELLRMQCGSLSGGQQRRVAVALAFVGRPDLVLLDEPTTGLDVDARRRLWDALRARHADGCTIVLTTHHLEEIEALAQRVVVIDRGAILADDTVAAIVDRVDLHRVTLRGTPPERLRALAIDVRVEHNAADGSVTVLVRDSDAFIRELVTSGAAFDGLRVRGASLEEAFLAITKEH